MQEEIFCELRFMHGIAGFAQSEPPTSGGTPVDLTPVREHYMRHFDSPAERLRRKNPEPFRLP
jgi:hypothetical protein